MLSSLVSENYLFAMVKPLLIRALILVMLALPLFPCRMLGIIALPGESLSSSSADGELDPFLAEELEAFRLQGGSGGWPYNNRDGWAMISYHHAGEALETQTVRSQLPAYSDDNYYPQTESLLSPVQVNVLLGHLRQSTSGAFDIENPHPFIYTRNSGDIYTFGHNGDLDKMNLRELIGDDWLALHPPQTHGGGPWDGSGWDNVVDSELFFFLIMQHIESSSSPLEGIFEALLLLDEQQPYNLKNFLFSDGNDLYTYRRSSASDIYYFDASNHDDLPQILSGSNHRVIMSTPPSDGLASELPWVALPDRSLLIFRGNGTTEVYDDFLSLAIFNQSTRPDQAELLRAYPNPFNQGTIIPLRATESGIFRLNIFNVIGQEVYGETRTIPGSGKYDFTWSGRDTGGNELTSGFYFYRITTDSRCVATGKLLMLK